MSIHRLGYLFTGLLVLILGVAVGSLQPGFVFPVTAAGMAQLPDDEDEGPLAVVEESDVPEKYRRAELVENTTQTTSLYFIPNDGDYSNTVINLANTTLSTVNVSIKAFYAGGAYSQKDFSIPMVDLVRLSADTIVPGAPPSWSDTVIFNFSDSVVFAILTIPSSGVFVDGYIAWSTTSSYDPDAMSSVLPLRFSTDPYSVHLPTIIK